MYYQFDSRLNMPAILFDDDRLVVGKNEYDYNDLTQIRIAKAPLLATYGIVELKTKDDRTIPVPFFKGDLHRLRVAVQELSHLLEVRAAERASAAAAGQADLYPAERSTVEEISNCPPAKEVRKNDNKFS